MAGGDAQNYVYSEIEQIVSEMQSFSSKIQQQAQDLTSQVTRLVDNGSWTGQSADDYKQRAGRLTGKLNQNAQTMQQTGQAVSQGAENMQQADKKGASAVSGGR